MDEEIVRIYYVAFNNAYADKRKAENVIKMWNHKNEKVHTIYVIMNKYEIVNKFCLDANWYNWFDTLEQAQEELS